MIGAGSDYVAFVMRHNIPSSDVRLRTFHIAGYPVYHSVYDDFNCLYSNIKQTESAIFFLCVLVWVYF